MNTGPNAPTFVCAARERNAGDPVLAGGTASEALQIQSPVAIRPMLRRPTGLPKRFDALHEDG
jgi:hypothetical protein